MAGVVHEAYARWARKTRAGRVVRCNRGRSITGPVLFETREAAQAVVDDLAAHPAVAVPYVAVACSRGRHWHVRRGSKEEFMPEAVDLSWAFGRDGDTVRAAARARVEGDEEAAPSGGEPDRCSTPHCDWCARARRAWAAG